MTDQDYHCGGASCLSLPLFAPNSRFGRLRRGGLVWLGVGTVFAQWLSFELRFAAER
jgi:hypothetical protein